MGKMTEKEMSHILKKGSWMVSMNFLKIRLMKCSLHLKVTHRNKESLFLSNRWYVGEKKKFVGDSNLFVINGKINTIFKLSLKDDLA